VNLETIFVNFVNLANFPGFAIFDVNLVSDFKLLPLTRLPRLSVHGPLVSIEFDLDHEDVSILNKMSFWNYFCPLILLILVDSFFAFDPEPRIPRRYIVEEFADFQMNLTQVERSRNEQ
jgi:hypothetical protein